MRERSCCSTPPAAFGVVSVPGFGPSRRGGVVSCCFTLHSPKVQMLVCYLYTFFGVRSDLLPIL